MFGLGWPELGLIVLVAILIFGSKKIPEFGSAEEIYMFGLGWPELGVIVLVAILIFGSKKIPEFGSAIGQSLRSFKDGLRQSSEESESISKNDE